MTEVFEKESTISQWDDDYYQPIALWLYDRAVSDMLGLMEVDVGETILDAGCGPGEHSIRIAEAGIRVCGVDISEAMLRHARQRTEGAGVSDIVEFCQGDLTNLGFPEASFRYVFSWGVVIHIPQAEKALDELARIIKPGGKLALWITNRTALDHKIESFVRTMLRKPRAGMQHLPLGDGSWGQMDEDRIWVWRFDASAVTDYLSTRGFGLKERRIGELSEMQRRFKGLPRRVLLHFNNMAYRLNLPPGLAVSTLLVFEKQHS